MVTFLIIAAVLSTAVGLWILNQKQSKDLNEVNSNAHPFVDDLAPEATPEPTVVKAMVEKTQSAPKKKAPVAKKPTAKKTAKKSK